MRITADLGELIRSLREARGITRSNLAEQAGVSVSHLEKNRNRSAEPGNGHLYKDDACIGCKYQPVRHWQYNAGKMYCCSAGNFFRLYRRRSEVSGSYGGMHGRKSHFDGIKGLYGPAKGYSCRSIFWQAHNIRCIKTGLHVCYAARFCGRYESYVYIDKQQGFLCS